MSALLLFYRTVMVLSQMSGAKMMVIVFVISYGAPLLIAVITVASSAGQENYIFRRNACWLNWYESKALLAFVIPAFTIVVINLVVLIVVLYKMLRRGVGAATQPDEKHALVVIARCVAILTPIFGLTWGFGIGTMVSQDLGIHVVFALLNSLQHHLSIWKLVLHREHVVMTDNIALNLLIISFKMQIVRIKTLSGSTEVTHWAEVMIEGNKTLNVAVQLPGLIGTSLDTTGVTITNAEIAAGMVYMEAPTGKVCYNSRQQLNCTSIEVMSKCVWQMSRGIYSCLFVTGNIAHMGIAPIQIALLPEVINVTSNPQTADCSGPSPTKVSISCSIENSTETYKVMLKLGSVEIAPIKEENNGIIKYTAEFPVDCQAVGKPTSLEASCTLENSLNQLRNRTIKVPIIYPSDLFCAEEQIAERIWPKTKNNETATIDCTAPGREGSMKRKCTGQTWGEEVSLCVKSVLNSVALQAKDFIDSASSMLNVTWEVGDKEETSSLATQYLSSVEGLVKNIRINATEGYNSSNIQLQICRNGSSCNRTVFNVDVELNATADMVKTVGLQSLANRLPKLGYENATFPSIVVSSTVENNTQASVNIRMAFPNEQGASAKMTCVFWNVTELRWSNEGCEFVKGPGNLAYCECNHLTSFSMLMSKHAVSMPFLDQLTYVGLGVSICSLIVYIIIECLVWRAVVKSNLSHFRHTALLNIALCLLLADCSFLASSFPSILNETLCLVLVVAKHYFFLAMFFWMLCLSVMLVHQLIFVFSHIGKKMYMILGFTIGYVCPTVTVAVTYVYYDQTRDIPYYSSKTCWLTYKSAMQGSIHAFLFPVGTIVLVNLFSMVVVIATVLKPSGAESNKKGDKDAAKSIIKVIMFLTPVFGGTWILGLFVFLMDDFTQFITYVVHYTFTIVNSLQGFFILLTGCFAEKRVRDEILRIVLGKSAKEQGTVTTTK
ncbi:hypothetical protein cypCar_00004433 [Cyprinus carpio]|nr:hypothetical protein cypCar_00004433 [Cyprinus carpio]